MHKGVGGGHVQRSHAAADPHLGQGHMLGDQDAVEGSTARVRMDESM